MNEQLKAVCESLDNLANKIHTATKDDRTLSEIVNWTCPPLNRTDLANLAWDISLKIKNSNILDLEQNISERIEEIDKRIQIFIKLSLPHLYNNNAVHASSNYLMLIEWINSLIIPLFDWQILHEKGALPKNLSQKLRAIKIKLDEIIPDKEKLEENIQTIQEATKAADTLPTDLQSLKEARDKVNQYCTDAAEYYGKIDTFHKSTENLEQEISKRKSEADKLVAQCEDAYRITTTKGLAAAFDLRATRLANSMWLWVFGLLIALAAGVYIGHERFEILNNIMNESQTVGYVWIQIILSALSLGAPIWLAWVSTKQISQRFKLSEDYAFKASVAKAYEGYKKEAARIDSNLESRLFGSALSRLEEAPLRLLNNVDHNTPWQELINSPKFQNALDKIPGFKTKLLNIVRPNIQKRTEKEIQELGQTPE